MSYSCAEWRGEIGAYIVGALHGRARARVGRHLVACPGCRAEYDDLVPVRAWLSQLATADDSPLRQPGCRSARGTRSPAGRPARGVRLSSPTGCWPSRRGAGDGCSPPVPGWLQEPPSAALLLAGPTVRTYHAVNTASGISGQAELHGTPAGTEIDLTASGLPAGERCILVAVTRGGADIAGTWNATYAGSARIAGTSAYPASQLTALRIETDNGLILLTIRV